MYDIMYMLCDCYVWPIVMSEHLGQCGRCAAKPTGFYRDEIEARLAFVARHGHDPIPIS